MRTLEDADIRRLVIETAERSPVMPDYRELVGGPRTTVTAVSSPHRRRSLLVAAAILATVGLGYLGLGRLNNRTVATSEETTAATETAAPTVQTINPPVSEWLVGSWPVLADPPEGYEITSAQRLGDSVRVVTYTAETTGQFVAVWTVDNLDPQSYDEDDPFEPTQPVTVNGYPGTVGWPGADTGISSIGWSQGRQYFSLDTDASIDTDGLIALAESVVPAADEAVLPITDFGPEPMPEAANATVATLSTDDGTVSLAAASDDGRSWSLTFHDESPRAPEPVGQRSPIVRWRPTREGRRYVYGAVADSVTQIELLDQDGSARPVDIQSRDPRHGVGFFLVETEDTEVWVRLRSTTGETLSIEPLRNAVAPLLLEELRMDPAEFVATVIGWNLDSHDTGRSLYTDPESEHHMYVYKGAEPGTVRSVGPDPESPISVVAKDGTLALRTPVSVEAKRVTVIMATLSDRVVVEFEDNPISYQWTYLDFPGITSTDPVAVLILYRDENGRVVSALSSGYYG